MKKLHLTLLTVLALAGLCISSTAYAACDDPVGAEGDQIYNPTHKIMQFCDGDKWVGMARAPAAAGGSGDNFGSHIAEEDLDASSFKIINLGAPVDGNDAATKAYVDSLTGTNEQDPQVGIITDGKWCTSSGTLVNCETNSPETPPGLFIAAHTLPNNIVPGTATTTAWTARTLNKVFYNNLAGASLASNAITLPAGTYYIDATSPFWGGIMAQTRLVNTADSTVLMYGSYETHETPSTIRGTFTLPSGGAVEVQYYANNNSGANDLGRDLESGVDEHYTVVAIKKVSDGVIADREPTTCGTYTTGKACPGATDPAQHLFSLASAGLTQNQCTTACQETGASCCTYISGTAGCYGSTGTDFDPGTPPVTYSSTLCGAGGSGDTEACILASATSGFATDGTYVYALGLSKLKAYSFVNGIYTEIASINSSGIRVTTGDGKIFVADAQILYAYTFNGSTFTAAGSVTVPGGSTIYDIHFGTSSLFVVTAGTTNALRGYTHSGSTFTAAGAFTGFTGSPRGVWSRGNSPVFVKETGGNTLRAFTYILNSFAAAGTYGSCGGSGDVWGDNNYIYAGCNTNGVRALTHSGSTFSLVSTYDPGTVWDVWSDGAGTVYIASDVGIEKLSFNGSAFTKISGYPSFGEPDRVTGNGSLVLGRINSGDEQGIREIGCVEACASGNGDGTACMKAGGVLVNGTCWFLGAANAACNTTCTNAGGTYNASGPTQSFAGSGGSNANCQTILDALTAPGTGASANISNTMGCYVNGTTRQRGTTATGASTTLSNSRRACACDITDPGPGLSTTTCATMGGTWAGDDPGGPSCFFLGAASASCDTTCTGKGLLYDESTKDYAGSSGDNSNCFTVLSALNAPGTGIPSAQNDGPVGCGVAGVLGTRVRSTTAPTTSAATVAFFRRACACQAPALACGNSPTGGKGYFVLTNAGGAANMGAWPGAKNMCLSKLRGYDWKGKDTAVINSTSVKPFLCTDEINDNSLCGDPLPDEEYSFAVMGSPSTGGTSFTTDSSGRAPANTTSWSGATYFGGNYTYWTNRKNAGTSSLWDSAPPGGVLSCVDWTSTSGMQWAGTGTSSATDSDRWTGNMAACTSTTPRMICVVDPAEESTNTDCTVAGGVEVGGGCWFFSGMTENCSATCALYGGTYNALTMSYAGSSGSDVNCNAVMDALQMSPGLSTGTTANAAGCHINSNGDRLRGTTATTDVANVSGGGRACACTPPPMADTDTECAADGGVPYGNACWYLGASAANCTSTCSAASGRVYDPATAYAGGDTGHFNSCTRVMNLLGQSGTANTNYSSQHYGCAKNISTNNMGMGTSATTEAASAANVQRACACKKPSGGGGGSTCSGPNGWTWTMGTTPATTWAPVLAYGNNIFVAGNYGNGLSSTNGSSWTARTHPVRANSIVYGDKFVAVGGGVNSGSSANRVMHSTDGISWTQVAASQSNEWTSVAYGGGLYVAVASNGTNRVMTSTTGTSGWTNRTAAEANSWSSVTYGDGKFVAVAANGTNRVMTSTNGTSWTPQRAPASGWTSVTYANGKFVAVANTGTTRVMTSPDGITWTGQTIASKQWKTVIYGNGYFLAGAENDGSAISTSSSTDGVTWSTPETTVSPGYGNEGVWISLVYGANKFVRFIHDENDGSYIVHTTSCGASGGGSPEDKCVDAGGKWIVSMNACYFWDSVTGGQSCNAVCGDAGGTCNLAKTVAIGSGGSNADCNTVLNALSVPGSSTTAYPGAQPIGCALVSSTTTRYRYTGSATTCAGSIASMSRACACDLP